LKGRSVLGLVEEDCFDLTECLRLVDFSLFQTIIAKALGAPDSRSLANSDDLNGLLWELSSA
jgi:hypothetical protein